MQAQCTAYITIKGKNAGFQGALWQFAPSSSQTIWTQKVNLPTTVHWEQIVSREWNRQNTIMQCHWIQYNY